MIDALRKLDFFPKANDEFRVKTTSGAVGKEGFSRPLDITTSSRTDYTIHTFF
jgi:hypothetical protein